MRINLRILAPSILLLFLFSSETSFPDERVGDVVMARKQSQIEAECLNPNGCENSNDLILEPDLIIEHGGDTRPVELNHILSALSPATDGTALSFLQMQMKDNKETTVIVRNGAIQIKKNDKDQLICHVRGKVLVEGSHVANEAQEACDLEAGGFHWRHPNTQFLIDARGVETSLFVMEGSVEVSSVDPNFPQIQEVLAGEWLMTRKGEPIPLPKKYRRTDVESGNSVCLYSWCRITRNVLTDGPERPLRVLIPPRPNPPGRQ